MDARILVTRPIPEAGLDRLRRAGADVELAEQDGPLPDDELRRRIADKHGLLCLLHDRIDEALLSAAPELRGIANYAVGHDNIDLVAATARGIPVSNTPDVLTDATADLAWALLLATARRLLEGEQLARSGEWAGWGPLQLLGREVSGGRLAIIGAGRIGQAVAGRAVGFGMRLMYVDREPRLELERATGAHRVELDEALEQADFVSLHLPLTQETRGMIGRRELARLPPGAVLINTSRGAVLDEPALIEALEAGRIRAGLDVYADEPRIPQRLRRLPNVVLLPHLGSATGQTRRRMAKMAADNLLAMLRRQRPPNLLNPEALTE